MSRPSSLLILAHGLALLLALLPGCSSPVTNLDPVGQVLPDVVGESLQGEQVRFPTDLEGPAILLVGYVQDAQFDLDRWILGLVQLGTPVAIYEVPTIDGLVPGMFAGSIDGGMRSGIPSEDWGAVVTLYDEDAARIVALTGNERPRNGRVLLLDGDGGIVWFQDRGYSAGLVSDLDAAARGLLEAR